MSGKKRNKLNVKKRARTKRILRAELSLINKKRETRYAKKQQEERNRRDQTRH